MADILIGNNFYIGTSSACIVDLTPPTFAGINFLDVESRGQIRAGWSVATDATPPLRYEIYIKASTATGLFNLANIIASTPNTQYDIFTLPDGSFLQNGVTYFVGVRAVDGVGNRDANLVSLNVISTGVLTSIDMYETEASWAISETGGFILTAWANKNSSLAISPDAILGTASYQVYDSSGAIIVGMSGSGISANAAGLYIFPSVTNFIEQSHDHYEIQVSISVDGEVRTNFLPVFSIDHNYDIGGVADVNDSNQITGSFWVSEHSTVITGAPLGTGSYVTYDTLGNLVPGLTESGIVADVNGFYIITPIPVGSTDITKAFVVKLTVIVGGENKSTFITLGNEPATYDVKAVFSINALNQLEASFWSTKNDEQVSGALLGTASYTIYDKDGIAVLGLTESGLTADGNGFYHITPVSAILLTDLTHYTAKIQIAIAGKNRIGSKGFTLLGT